jgi:eukaryotic-like serine/threonine-protein kinase
MLMQRSAECFAELGDVRNACVQRVNVAYASLSVGELETSAAAFYAVLQTTISLGLDTVTSVGRHNLGYVLALLGRVEEAEHQERLALEAFQAHGDVRMQGTSRTYLALIALMRGDQRTAIAEARAALALAPEVAPSRAIALATLASVLLGQEATRVEAYGHAKESIAMLQTIGGVDEGEGLIRLIYARCLHASGEIDAAKAAIEAASDRLHARALRITPEHLREGFLMRLPDHALTLALAEEWLS